MNYTEEDLRNAFIAGSDSQYENDFNLTLKEEENKFVNELIEVKKMNYIRCCTEDCKKIDHNKDVEALGLCTECFKKEIIE